MAATENVRQLPQSHNSSAEFIVPRHGIVTLFGYQTPAGFEQQLCTSPSQASPELSGARELTAPSPHTPLPGLQSCT
jgi:hypothetical protein